MEERSEESDISYISKQPANITTHEKHMMFTLDKKAIDYIEERRHKTKNQDVIFIFYVTLSVLIPPIRIGEFRPHGISDNIQIVRFSPGNPAGADQNFNLLVLTNPEEIKNMNRLFEEKIVVIKRPYTIPSSNWANDFQEHLGLGKFLIVEIPFLTTSVNSIDDSTLNANQKELKNRLLRALELTNDIQKDIREGEWGEAVKGCRDAIEPFSRGPLTSLIKEIVIYTTGIEEEKANRMTMAFDNLYGYTSGLHHQLTKDARTVAVQYKGRKEDAYLNYMITVGIINTIARKFILYSKQK